MGISPAKPNQDSEYARIYKTHSNADIRIRELRVEDYSAGFFETLSVLKRSNDKTPDFMDKNKFDEFVQHINNSGYTHKILVAENLKAIDPKKKIIGTGSVFVEPKFIHKGGKVAHIEDVAVHPDSQKQGIGLKITLALKDVGIAAGCYKVILDCSESNIDFYKKCGFEKKNVQMAYYIDEEKDKIPSK